MIEEHIQYNFEQLQRAAKNKDMAIVECTEKVTGKVAVLLCAIFIDKEGAYNMIPYARMLEGDPYEDYLPPMDEKKEQR